MKILFLTANYLRNRQEQDSFRKSILDAVRLYSDEVLYFQYNDFCSEQSGDFYSAKDQQAFLKRLKDFSPDKVISINGSGLNDAILSEISGIETHVWFVDAPWRFPEHILKPLKDRNNIYTYAASGHAHRWLGENKVGNSSGGVLHFATRENLVLAPKKLEEREYSYSLLGTLWDSRRYGNELKALKCDRKEISQLYELLKGHFSSYNYELANQFREIVPRSELSDSEIFSIFDDECSTFNRRETLKALSSLEPRGVIHGTPEWMYSLGLSGEDLNFCFDPSFVMDIEDQYNLYRNSMIGLNICHHQSKEGGAPIRCFDLWGAGTALITNSPLEEDSLKMKQGHNYFLYDGSSDVIKTTKKIIESSEYMELVKETQKIVIEYHTYKNRARFFCNTEERNEMGPIYCFSKFKMNFENCLENGEFEFKEGFANSYTYSSLVDAGKLQSTELLKNFIGSMFSRPRPGRSRKKAFARFLDEIRGE